MAEAYGATQEAWHHWSEALGLREHLLPVVANPGATISPDSKIKTLGKTPTRYNYKGEVSGLAKWTELRASAREVGDWALKPDYGICVQSRRGGLRALDIDVPNAKASREIVEIVENTLPLCNWVYRRTRANTGKLLLPFRYEGEMPKAVLQVEGGAIELLGEGQQWIAESSYLMADKPKQGNTAQRANGRYLWPAGWPPTIDHLPLLEDSELKELRDALELLVGVPYPKHRKGESLWMIARIARERPLVDGRERPGAEDVVAEWLLRNWDIRDEGGDGELYVRCPFDAEHTSDSGPTETVYYPAGTRGYERGHFKCLHAHCMARTDDDYLTEMGYSIADEFPLVEDEPGREIERAEPQAPRFMIDKQGRKECRSYNHKLFLQQPECGKRIAWDDFSAQIIWCPAKDKVGEERWKLFSDEHYVQLVEQMDRNGFVPQSPSSIRAAVHEIAMRNPVDLAIAWAERLPEWDGVPRVERFWIDYAGAADNAYTRAVGRYSWTAQAGRLLEPGSQVDMMVTLVGEQGKRKSTLLASLVPAREMFTEINLMQRDDDTSRKMRGKLVIEIDELRGLGSRSSEDVKSFISRPVEEWTPKYQEFSRQFKRRFVFYGSTNKDAFLSDSTGERRHLPLRVGLDGQLRVEEARADREQLWAEAVMRWGLFGVEWQDAERLALDEHEEFKDTDAWGEAVKAWVHADDPFDGGKPIEREFTHEEALVGALGMRAALIDNRHTQRMGAVLKSLGFRNTYTRRGRRYVLVDPKKCVL